MWKTLRIIFTVIAALCVAAVFPVGTLLHWIWAAGLAVAAVVFACFMLFCKRKMEEQEEKEKPSPDFFTPNDEEKPLG
jgi:uncharacterized membrane protein YciS (DUF1049 family)